MKKFLIISLLAVTSGAFGESSISTIPAFRWFHAESMHNDWSLRAGTSFVMKRRGQFFAALFDDRGVEIAEIRGIVKKSVIDATMTVFATCSGKRVLGGKFSRIEFSNNEGIRETYIFTDDPVKSNMGTSIGFTRDIDKKTIEPGRAHISRTMRHFRKIAVSKGAVKNGHGDAYDYLKYLYENDLLFKTKKKSFPYSKEKGVLMRKIVSFIIGAESKEAFEKFYVKALGSSRK